MIRNVFFFVFVFFFSFSAYSQEAGKIANDKKAVESKVKKVQRPILCNLNKDEEIKNLLTGDIIDPSKLNGVRSEISELTSCAVSSIFIISGSTKGNTADYIACACGIKVQYKAEYTMKISSVINLTETVLEER